MRLVRIGLCLPLAAMMLFLAPLGERTHIGPVGQAASVSEDEKQLEKNLQSEDVSAVLAFFRKRTPSVAEAERLRGLITQLGHETLAERDRALYELLARGRAVRGL